MQTEIRVGIANNFIYVHYMTIFNDIVPVTLSTVCESWVTHSILFESFAKFASISIWFCASIKCQISVCVFTPRFIRTRLDLCVVIARGCHSANANATDHTDVTCEYHMSIEYDCVTRNSIRFLKNINCILCVSRARVYNLLAKLNTYKNNWKNERKKYY